MRLQVLDGLWQNFENVRVFFRGLNTATYLTRISVDFQCATVSIFHFNGLIRHNTIQRYKTFYIVVWYLPLQGVSTP